MTDIQDFRYSGMRLLPDRGVVDTPYAEWTLSIQSTAFWQHRNHIRIYGCGSSYI